MAACLNDVKTSKKDCILSKSIFFVAEVHWANIESDKKIKFNDIGTLIICFSKMNFLRTIMIGFDQKQGLIKTNYQVIPPTLVFV